MADASWQLAASVAAAAVAAHACVYSKVKRERAKLTRLSWQQPAELAVIRMPEDAPWPPAPASGFYSVTRAPGETSIVMDAAAAASHKFDASAGVKVETGWAMFKLEGPLDFSLIGILSQIATVLALEGISIFAISTYDTDWVLIKEEKKKKATKALAGAGYMWI
jgi:hypothetical protein